MKKKKLPKNNFPKIIQILRKCLTPDAKRIFIDMSLVDIFMNVVKNSDEYKNADDKLLFETVSMDIAYETVANLPMETKIHIVKKYGNDIFLKQVI
jgi:hypothetical protein